MRTYFLLLALFISCFTFGQFTDDFTDGDFTANPVWTPLAPTDFVVASGQLQSNNTTASSTFYITTPSATATDCQWEFFVNLKFATSGTNYVDVYLTADNSDLTLAGLNGYFVRIGNTNDEVCLYSNVAGTQTKIIDGVDGVVASSSNNLIKIKVTRDASNMFDLQRDMGGTGTSYVSEGTITDATFTTSSFFGILIKQSTASFFQKHFFDDFYVGPIPSDIIPPSILSSSVISSTQLDVQFNEALDAGSSQTTSNYSVNNTIGNPSSAVQDGSDPSLMHLTFATPFTNGQQYILTVNGVQDLSSNAISGGTSNFTYLVFSSPAFKDVIINEIMVDVNPAPAGVPAKQYLELYNNSANYFNLNGWQFADATSTSTINYDYTFAPGAYVLIAKTADTALFTGTTNKVGTSTFPTYNTTGDPVFLKDNAGNYVDSMRYSTAWYHDASKSAGGWSLELINPGANASCSTIDNWAASIDANGGTPGAQNSVYSTAPDITPPAFTSLTIIDSVSVQLCFGEAIDAALISNPSNYSVDNGIGAALTAVSLSGNTCVTVTFASAFQTGMSNTITFSSLTDCNGNNVTPGSAVFTYYQVQTPAFKDVILTEIMIDVNPAPASVPAKQYIELFNNSSKYFDLNGWQFADAASTSTISGTHLFAPGEYVLIAKSSDTGLFTGISNKIGTSTFPSYNVTGDPVFILDNSGNYIDSIRYTIAWYHDAVKASGGWSLELINPGANASCSTIDNWAASVDANGGTPGIQNSIYSTAPDITAPVLNAIIVMDSLRLQLCFDEAIDASLISDPSNYSVDNGIGAALTAVASSGNNCVTLTFANVFQTAVNNTVTFSSLADCNGNNVNPGSTTFTYYQIKTPSFKDVILTEIMVDVSPAPMGVPAKQYIELYNNSNKYFDLSGWQFADAASASTISGSHLFAPGDYVLIAKSSDTSLFTGISNKIGTSTFPSYNVTGDPVFIMDNGGNYVDSIRYTTAWYHDVAKSSGGWSLELINPDLNTNCFAENNWTASTNANGGTPGAQNSVYSTSPDIIAPQLSSITVLDSMSLRLCFSEAISLSLISDPSNYTVDNSIGNPASVISNTTYNCVTLSFANAFVSQTAYTVNFGSLADCNGNVVTQGSAGFVYYQTSMPQYNDVIINELMIDVNPPPNAVPAKQYLELYNKSTKYFDLHNWQISDPVNSYVVGYTYILAPGNYVLIAKTADTALFIGINNKIGLSSLPSFNTTGDGVYVQDNIGNYVDTLHYTDDWYRNATQKLGGWSLERINPTLNQYCEISNNWRGTVSLNGGTPGVQNSVYNVAPDVTGPQPLQVSVTDSLHITICFNEAIASDVVANSAGYIISNGVGAAIFATVSGSSSKCVDLTLANALQDQTNYTLSFSGLEDCSNNLVSPNNIAFSYYIANPYDVVVNEIFADPDPQVALPQSEYIELYNKSAFNVSLKNWKLTVGNKDMILPDAVILPDSFVVIVDAGAEDDFLSMGYVNIPLLVLNEMSSNELNSSGEEIMLRDNFDNIISDVYYHDSWYGDNTKKAGGWSLEQIDPSNPCAGSSNWRASANANGGTPGSRNSIKGSNPDNTSPQVLLVNVIAADTLMVMFNEPMQYNSVINASAYTINNGVGSPVAVIPQANDYKKCLLVLSNPIHQSVIYTLSMTHTAYDCAGNLIASENTARFGLPEMPLEGDLLINEILFNPKVGGVDYLELYNNSDKIIDLYDVYVGQGSETGTIISDSVQITPDGYQIFPGEYVCLSENQTIVKSQYATENPKWFLDMDKLPSMNSSEDNVVIADKLGNEIDKVQYNEKMHFALLNDVKGVSLERIDFNRPSNDETNWNSAAANVGFGTPAYRNSQYLKSESTGNFSVSPEIFSPDNDGYNDVVTINYAVNESGLAANITIFDSRGALIRYLVKNENLATSGSYSWNGITEKGERAPIGIYVIYFETFSTSGKVEKHKLTCVLAGKM